MNLNLTALRLANGSLVNEQQETQKGQKAVKNGSNGEKSGGIMISLLDGK